jgi:membrane protease YdiL (CAAX protease family)
MVSVAVLVVVVGLRLVDKSPKHPLKQLDHPVATTLRVCGRELDRAAIIPRLSAWQRVGSSAIPSLDLDVDVLGFAAAQYRDLGGLLDRGELDEPLSLTGPVRARLALVLAEAGRWSEAQAALAKLEAPALAQALAAGYRPGSPPPAAEVLERALAAFADPALPQGVDDWPLDRLRARVLARTGDQAGAARANAAIEARGWRTSRRATLAAVPMFLALLGLLVAGGLLLTGRRLQPVAAAVTTAPYPLGHGLALLVRAAAEGLVLAILLTLVQGAIGVEATGLYTLVSTLPLMLYVRGELAAHGMRVVPSLGLTGVTSRHGLLLATLLLVGLETALSLACDGAFTAAGRPTHFSEAFVDDSLLLGGWGPALLGGIEAVIWAPLFEEIAFRGVLYPILRTRLTPLPAAALSALVFAGAHTYSPGALVAIFLGAVASALVYERTRSLWPSMIAHAFNNMTAVAATVLIYR